MVMCMRTMAELTAGETGVVAVISEKCPIKRRLTEIGLTSGTSVLCVRESPLGDPRAFLIRGTVFAVRRQDAAFVKLASGAVEV